MTQEDIVLLLLAYINTREYLLLTEYLMNYLLDPPSHFYNPLSVGDVRIGSHAERFSFDSPACFLSQVGKEESTLVNINKKSSLQDTNVRSVASHLNGETIFSVSST